jgi:hypothetical protein
VAAAPHRELGAGLPCQSHDARDVRCVADADDGRWPTVEAGEEHSAHVVVPGVVRADHLAFQAGAEVGDLDIGFGLHMVLLRSTTRLPTVKSVAVASTANDRTGS